MKLYIYIYVCIYTYISYAKDGESNKAKQDDYPLPLDRQGGIPWGGGLHHMLSGNQREGGRWRMIPASASSQSEEPHQSRDRGTVCK